MSIGGLLLHPGTDLIAGAALDRLLSGVARLVRAHPGNAQADSIWPTQQGIALSKDAWMLGIGLSLLIDS